MRETKREGIKQTDRGESIQGERGRVGGCDVDSTVAVTANRCMSRPPSQIHQNKTWASRDHAHRNPLVRACVEQLRVCGAGMVVDRETIK